MGRIERKSLSDTASTYSRKWIIEFIELDCCQRDSSYIQEFQF